MKSFVKILIIAIVAILVVIANVSRRNAKIKGITVHIDYNGADTLVSADKVELLIIHELPHLTSLLVKEVDAKEISKAVSLCPYLEDNEVSVSLGCQVVVKASQRRPILRLFYDGEEFYLDHTGHCVPVSNEGSCDVPVANGIFKQHLGPDFMKMDLNEYAEDSARCHYDIVRLWKTACYLDDHDLSNGHFDQIYVDKNGDIYLVPVVGDFTINIGGPDNLQTKFNNLQKLYDKALPKVGWDYYSNISLKYRNQVVCTKKQP